MRVCFRHRFAAGAQRTVCRVVMFFLFRALNALSVRDSRVAAEIAPWPEARVLGLEVPGGPSLYIARRAERLARMMREGVPEGWARIEVVPETARAGGGAKQRGWFWVSAAHSRAAAACSAPMATRHRAASFD